MNRFQYYHIEWFSGDDNGWIFEPERKHRNLSNAINNADILKDSKKCSVRVIYEGKIVYQATRRDYEPV